MMKRAHEDDEFDEHPTLRATGIQAAPSPAKFIHVEDSDGGEIKKDVLIECVLPPHQRPVPFYTYTDYEQHYQRIHVHFCTECNRIFPSNHYLELHISEHHDPIMDARRSRGEKTYGCLVEGCERLCSTAPKRRLHVLDKHDFPKDYNFWIIKWGNSGRRQPGNEVYSHTAAINANRLVMTRNNNLGRRPSDCTTTPRTETTEEEDQEDKHYEDAPQNSTIASLSDTAKTTTPSDVDNITTSLGKLDVAKAKPKLTFGKGQRGGFAR